MVTLENVKQHLSYILLSVSMNMYVILPTCGELALSDASVAAWES